MWGADGGHPNWHPDGQHLIRVMKVGDAKRLCQFRYDAADFQVLGEKILGGGHPTFEGGGRFIVTDDYQDGSPQQVVIQLIDMQREQLETVCTLPTMPHGDKIEYDGAPAGRTPDMEPRFPASLFSGGAGRSPATVPGRPVAVALIGKKNAAEPWSSAAPFGESARPSRITRAIGLTSVSRWGTIFWQG